MSVASYLTGVGILAVIVLPWGLAGARCRIWLAPSARGATARLIESILGISGLVVVVEIVGAVGGFHRLPLALASAGSATALAGLAIRRSPKRVPTIAEPAPVARFDLAVAAAAVFAVTAQWLAGVTSSYRTGILQVESLHYHLTHAAYFVQTGTLWKPHEVSASVDAAFHPLNVELLHAVGMVALQSDFGSLFVNIGLLWLALLAAWVAGERAGAGPAAVCVVALFAAAAPLGGVAGGTGLNDIGVMAFVLAAVALLDWPDPAPSAAPGAARLVLVGLALGLALGSKLTAPAVVVALAVGLVWLSRGPGSARRLLLLVGSIVATGGFWYLRDWVFFGSPLPSLPLSVGGVGLPSVPQPVLVGTEFSVAHYLGDPGVIRHWFVPALHVDFGPAWPVVLALPLAGVVLACRSGRSRVDRVLAAVAGFGFVAYLLTPSGAQGAAGQPILFGSNVRYAMPALIVGGIVLVRDPWLARRRTVAALLLLLEIVTLLPARFWSDGDVVAGLAGALGCAVAFTAMYAAWTRGPRALGAAVLSVLAILGVVGLPAERHYLANRYTSTATPTDALFAWSRGVANTRIGGVGFPTLYPFYRPNFSNHVQYVGQPAAHHAFNDYTACAPWVRALVAGRYQYVVVIPFPDGSDSYARFAAWTHEAGGTLAFRNSAGWVYRLPASLSVSGCR